MSETPEDVPRPVAGGRSPPRGPPRAPVGGGPSILQLTLVALALVVLLLVAAVSLLGPSSLFSFNYEGF